MTGEVLSRTTLVHDVAVLLFSFDGQRWDSDLKRLRAWHRNQAHGPKWSWGDKRSAARGNQHSAQTHRKKARKPIKTADGLAKQNYWADELPQVIDNELLTLESRMPVKAAR
jgi:hypothetical protein